MRFMQIKRQLGLTLFNLDAKVRQIYANVSVYKGGKAVPPPAEEPNNEAITPDRVSDSSGVSDLDRYQV